MSEGPSRLSIRVSMGDYQNTTFMIGGENPDEFVANVQRVFQGDSSAVLEKFKQAFLNAPYYDITGASSAPSQPADPAPPAQTDPWAVPGSQGATQSQPAASQPPSTGSGTKVYPEDPGKEEGLAALGGQVPQCDHGPKVWKNPPGKPWKGFFCSAKQRAGNCAATWVNDN